MPLRLTRARDADEFEHLASDFLAAREAEHNLLFGIVAGIRSGTYAQPPYLAVVRDRDRVVAAALRTPPLSLVLSAIDDDGALAVLADDAMLLWSDLPGVHGQKRDASAFASLWERRTGAVASVFTEQRIYQLQRVDPPRSTSGRMRVALPHDIPLVARWLDAFGIEALRNPPDAGAARGTAERFVAGTGSRTLYLWDFGGPVSMTLASAVTPNGSRVGAVYTPPELRGRGYASALVAAASQAQFDAGRRYCFLFTDLANPTSNRIYQAIGYEPVCDVDEYHFAGPAAHDQS